MYYEDNVKIKVDWKGLIFKLIAVVLLILVFIWLFPMPKLDTFYSRVYNENLNTMKEAAEKYFVQDKLPEKTGGSNTLKLQEMLDKKLISEFTDKNNNECSSTNSFAQVTKTENNNYVLKIQLSCDDKTDYVLETLNTTSNNSTSNSIINNNTSNNTNSNSNSNNSGNSNSNTTNNSSINNNAKDEDDGIIIDESIIKSSESKYDKGSAVEYEYKRAITKTSTTYVCPEGYIKDGNSCYRYDTGETIDATPLYFDDVVQTNDAKINKEGGYTKTAEPIKSVVSSEDICPEGYTKNGNICYKYINATVVPGTTTYSCPDGYTLNGTSCVTTAERIEIRGKDTYYCPSGYVLNGTKCTSTVDRIENREKDTYTCPSGYTLKGNMCEKTVDRQKVTNDRYSCPSGYTLSSNKKYCTRTTSAARSTTPGSTNCSCPSGYSDNGSNCYKQTSYTGTYHAGSTNYGNCPSGWSASGSQCIKAASVSVSWSNPQYVSSKTQLSEYDNGTTKRVRNGNPSCNAAGCTYYYVVYTATKSYSCSSGTRSGTNCVTSRPTSTSNSYYTCNDGRTQSSSTCYTTSYANKNCTTTPSTTNYTCPSGYDRNGSTCTKTINSTKSTDVSYTCPSGYYQDGKKCVSRISSTEHRGKVYYTCPSGYKMNGSVCQRTIDASKSKGDVTYICPTGYAMKGTICEKVIDATAHTTETEYTCPDGYVKKGTTCYQYTEPTTKKTYRYDCPEGYTKEGDGEATKCTMTVESKETYYCESDEEELVGDKCVKTIKGALKGYSCPSGYILDKDKCIKHTKECGQWQEVTNTSTTYEYKWSSESSLDGWTQTGKTRGISSSSENLYEK